MAAADVFTGLLIPSDAELREAAEQAKVCAFTLDDLEDWKKYLNDPKMDPTQWLRRQRQRRNDCQGQAITSGGEKIVQIVTGSHRQLSDTYAYNASEYIGGGVGRDSGSTIQSGVKVLTKGIGIAGPGLPTEERWPYDSYERNKNRFASRAKNAVLVKPAIIESYTAPPFQQAIAVVVAGGVIHWGTWWGLKWDSDRVVRKYKGRHGRGGHATEIVWAKQLSNGEWVLVVLNSHGDGYYFVNETAYEEMRDPRLSPFGAYALLPDKPVERYYTVQQWKNSLAV